MTRMFQSTIGSHRSKQAFTLVELLLVVAIMVTLVVTTMVYLNPEKHLAEGSDLQRKKDILELQHAIQMYLVDHDALTDLRLEQSPGVLVASIMIPTSAPEAVDICRHTTSRDACLEIGGYDLGSQIIPGFMKEFPVDPAEEHPLLTGYRVWRNGPYYIVCSRYGSDPCGMAREEVVLSSSSSATSASTLSSSEASSSSLSLASSAESASTFPSSTPQPSTESSSSSSLPYAASSLDAIETSAPGMP